MDLFFINDAFLDQLRLTESRIPLTEYGKDKWKPFFGILFTIGGLSYVTNISSPKPRHDKMKDDKDFIKILNPSPLPGTSSLMAVINLNFMFPVPCGFLHKVDYSTLQSLLPGKSPIALSSYWSLLQKQLTVINTLDIDKKAIDLYNHVQTFPSSRYSQRCFNFLALEITARTLDV